jgi:hypothetical protein
MTDLGPLFGKNAIQGPLYISYVNWNNHPIYLIGERHTTNGKVHTNSLHVVEYIQRFHSAQQKVRLYCELNEMEVVFYASRIKMSHNHQPITPDDLQSPLYTFAYYYAQNKFDTRYLNVVWADVRKSSPYNLYLLIHNPLMFSLEHYGPGEFLTKLQDIKGKAKEVEKQIFQHLSTRKKTIAFLEAMYLPGKKYPVWFINLYKILHMTNGMPTDDLRNKMKVLEEKNKKLYDTLVYHMKSYYVDWAVSPYTQTLERLESMRHTQSPNLVAEKSASASDILIEISSSLLDLQILLDIYLNPPANDETIIVMAGLYHTSHLSRFFAQNHPISHKYNDDGNITSGDARAGFITINPRIPSKLIEIKGQQK